MSWAIMDERITEEVYGIVGFKISEGPYGVEVQWSENIFLGKPS